jgi:hypothetical protein
MAGLLNIVPRYLPRYGMAPEWGRAVRPLVLVYTSISFVVTIAFGAGVDAQAGAYATGVLAMMTSAAFAVTLATWRGGSRWGGFAFGVVAAVFVYAMVANAVQRPDGLLTAFFFGVAIVVVSLISRVQRSTELRQERIEVDEAAQGFIEVAGDHIHLVAHRRRHGTEEEYARKEREQREDNHIPPEEPIIFLEVQVEDASEFEDVLEVRGVEVGGHKVLRPELGGAQRHRGLPAARTRHDGQDATLLLRLDGRQPHRLPVPLSPIRGGGYRPRHPRGLA